MTYEDKLNLQQRKAVEHTNGPLLIIAGAGTGKTTVICERINYLITRKNIQADQILALTFTEKAASEMEERVDKALPYGYTDLWISTFHSFAERLLREHGLEIGLATNFKLLDETAAWVLARNNLDRFNLNYYKPLGNPSKFIHALLKHFSKCKDELIRPKDYLDYAESYRLDNDLRKDESAGLEAMRLEEISNAYHAYQQLLLDSDYLDFGDLLNYAYELLLKRPKILNFYQGQFKYILVDEFQDTNYAQYQLVKLLAKPNNNITVVGDDDQSIYKFRGASIANILEFKSDYPNAKEIFLTDNYRSKQNILDASYKFIQLNNPNRLEAQLKAAHVKCSAGLKSKNLSKKLSSKIKGKGVIEHLHAKTCNEEVAIVVNKIVELYNADSERSFNNFAILVRANDQAKPFIEGLETAGVPYQYVASRGLYAKPVVLNLIAFLKLLDDYHESDAMYRYLTIPIFRIVQEEIIRLTHLAYKKSWTLFETARKARLFLNLPAEAIKELERAVGYLEKFLSASKEAKASKIVFDFLDESGYLKYINTLPELEKRREFSYIGQLYRKIKAFEEIEDDKTVKNFLRRLGLELEAGEQGDLNPLSEDEGPEMVKVMTVHSAKGLEFKYVFLANMVDQRFPTRERSEPIELPEKLIKEKVPEGDIHLQEERRLFYVGLTRAKDGVFFSSADDYGGARKKKISVFLSDLGFATSAAKKIKEEKLESIERIKSSSQKIIKEFLPSKFSFTQIKDFQNCPRVYYYRYILHVPLSGSHYFSFGSTIHLTLQKFFEEVRKRQGSLQADLFSQSKLGSPQKKSIKGLVNFDELFKIYEALWIDDWYKDKTQKEQYFQKGKEILKDFYESRYLEQSAPVYLEKMFNFKICGYSITGKIDRIDEFDGGLKIIDYKTGKPKEKLEAEDKEQLLIYQMAAIHLFKQPIKGLAYYYLENGTQVDFLGEQKEIAKLSAKIVDTIKQIEDFDFIAFLSTHNHCDYCRNIM